MPGATDARGPAAPAPGTPHDPVAAAVALARLMVEEGAELLDVGGASSRPGHLPVAPSEEAARIVPTIRAIVAALPAIPISVDTTSPEVAEAALDAGAVLLNDIRGHDADPRMLALAAARGVPLLLMHGRLEARPCAIAEEVVAELGAAVARAVAAGVPEERILVDPGIGFGKTPDQNLELLRRLDALRVLGRPVLLGTSRKSTLGRLLDLPPSERVEATVATTVLGVASGADIVRVHDVRENLRAARVADAILRGWRPGGWGSG